MFDWSVDEFFDFGEGDDGIVVFGEFVVLYV